MTVTPLPLVPSLDGLHVPHREVLKIVCGSIEQGGTGEVGDW